MLLFLLLIIDLYFLICTFITHIFNPIAELIIPIGIPTKEAKAEMETHLLIVEIKISAQYNSKLSIQTFLCFLLINSF